jgi:hypothetical protein
MEINRCPIKLNPYVNTVPKKFDRYQHPSHKHKLFMILNNNLNCRVCDNNNCNECIDINKTVFYCPRCDFDLCEKCFQLGCEKEVPLSEDDCKVDETTIKELKDLFVVRLKCCENCNCRPCNCTTDNKCSKKCCVIESGLNSTLCTSTVSSM